MITLIQMEYIVAVDTYRHFVTASEKCFVTQPTLSMQIKKLEEELDVIVFDRTKQPIVPTEIGEKIIEQARITLAESKRINELVEEHNNTVSGELIVGVIPSLAPYLLPLFIGRFSKSYPGVRLKVVELLTDDIIEHLRKDKVDLGILVTPLYEKGIIEIPLFFEEMVLFVNDGHPIANKKDIRTSELENNDLWMLSNGHCFRSQVINLCKLKSEPADSNQFVYESGSLETLKKLVLKEGGYTLLPELAIGSPMKDASIKRFKSKPLREVSFAYTRNYSKRRLMEALSEEIKASIPKAMLEGDVSKIVEWR